MRFLFACIISIVAAFYSPAFCQGQNGGGQGAAKMSSAERERAKNEYIEMAEGLRIEIEESERIIDRARLKIKQSREELDRGIRSKSLSEEEIADKRRKINAAERKLKVLETRLLHAKKYAGEI